MMFQVNGNAWGCPVGPPVTGSYITPSVNIFTISNIRLYIYGNLIITKILIFNF